MRFNKYPIFFNQIHDISSKQEDLIYNPDLTYSVLNRYNLISNASKRKAQTKCIAVFDYLFDTSQIYVILKSLWKLNIEDTSIISAQSLKVVLDWSWSKFSDIKEEMNKLCNLFLVITLFILLILFHVIS